MNSYLTRDEVVATFPNASWEKVIFSEFEATLTSSTRPFPCVFGVSGFKTNKLRYAFADPLNPETLAPKPIDVLRPRSAMMRSRPANAPPQMNRMFVVST